MTQATLAQQTPSWVWESNAVLDFKFEKTVATLSAVRKALLQRTSRSKAESDFCEQVDWALSLPEQCLGRVLRDPQAYFFARTTYDLFLGVYLGRDLPSGTHATVQEQFPDLVATSAEVFDRHLNQFGLFAVSLALASKRSVQIEPLVLALPAILPGTAWSFAGTGMLAIHGVTNGVELDMAIDGEQRSIGMPLETIQVDGLLIRVAPCLEQIRLQPSAFNVPGLVDIRSVVPAELDGQDDYVELLSETIGLIRRHDPQTADQIEYAMQVIAFKPPGYGGVFNTSCSRLPGAAIFTGARSSLVLADDLIHEFYHNRLFAIEEQGNFFAASNTTSHQVPDTVYSPWRDDPRPIYGLFHAAYVFERVLQFWLSAIESGQLAASELPYANYRATKLLYQLQISLSQLVAWGDFTERGQVICDAIMDSLGRHASRCETLGLDGQVEAITLSNKGNLRRVVDGDGNPMTVEEEIQRHIAIYDVHGRTAQSRKESLVV
ncbi:HEXXH motif-containing putative peptide modification protein [Stieleria sp. JC731]|uniref:aKG-HExxH-type peptide beta-hydroxylase n=1 Tax=Pirellulaceae TaxID=2691357 RepID=UPI001E3457B7|nr:HEXXH motif-containing putative peptide modification protein [Stieleria sp. JC731]MCC9600388.1 HEXXH motif-containing putative peptide modification protein [Stieleria sp. JC731]